MTVIPLFHRTIGNDLAPRIAAAGDADELATACGPHRTAPVGADYFIDMGRCAYADFAVASCNSYATLFEQLARSYRDLVRTLRALRGLPGLPLVPAWPAQLH